MLCTVRGYWRKARPLASFEASKESYKRCRRGRIISQEVLDLLLPLTLLLSSLSDYPSFAMLVRAQFIALVALAARLVGEQSSSKCRIAYLY